MNKQKTIGATAAALALAAMLAVFATAALAGQLRPVAVHVTFGTYSPKLSTCVDTVCAVGSDYDARYVVRADLLNPGQALVVLSRLSDDTTIWSVSVPVTPYGTRPGGWLSVRTGILDCAGGANTAPNAYFRVKEGVSGRWSNRQYVTTGCSAS